MRVHPVREGVAIALITVLSIGVNLWWTYERAVEALQGEIKEGLQRTVAANAEMLDGVLADQHRAFQPPERAGNYYDEGNAASTYAKAWERLQTDLEWVKWREAVKASPNYREWTHRMESVRKATAHVRYLYTCVLIDGRVYFGFDEAPQNDAINNKVGPYEPGGDQSDGLPDPPPTLLWPYPDAGAGLIEALTKGMPVVEAEHYSDSWGTYYSAYAPFYDSEDKLVGVLGMDLELEGFNKRLEPVQIALKRTAVTGLCLAILSGVAVWFARRLALQASQEGGESGRATLAEQQTSAGAFAEALLKVAPEDARELLSATAPVGESANFPVRALQEHLIAKAAADTISLSLDFDPEIPGTLYGVADRVEAAMTHAIRHVAVEKRVARLSVRVVEEMIQWLRIEVIAGNCAASGDHSSAADLISQGLYHAALAQAHARAIGGDGVADGEGIRLVLPLRKERL